MARYKVLVIVPFPLSEKGMANRRAQLAGQVLDPEIEFEFKPVKSSGALLDSNPDFLQLDVAIYEAGIDAERDGYSAATSERPDPRNKSGRTPVSSGAARASGLHSRPIQRGSG